MSCTKKRRRVKVDKVRSSARCSDTPSPLVERFTRRAGASTVVSPEEAMRSVVSSLRRRYRGDGFLDDRMRFYLSNRQVISTRIVEGLESVATLEPIGSRYVHGFNILLARQSNHTRLRFTLAHEICHT